MSLTGLSVPVHGSCSQPGHTWCASQVLLRPAAGADLAGRACNTRAELPGSVDRTSATIKGRIAALIVVQMDREGNSSDRLSEVLVGSSDAVSNEDELWRYCVVV